MWLCAGASLSRSEKPELETRTSLIQIFFLACSLTILQILSMATMKPTLPAPFTGSLETTSEGDLLIKVNIFLVLVTVVVFCLRIYARVYLVRAPGVDDCVAAIAFVRLPSSLARFLTKAH